jgi:flagellar assembly protein FliH
MSTSKSSAVDGAAVWSLPTVRGPLVSRTGESEQAYADRQRRTLHEEAYAKGKQEGFEAGRAEYEARIAALNARVEQFDAVLQILARPLDQLDAEVETLLATLAIAIARQVVRRELKSDPEQVIAVIRETVGLLPTAARDVRVHLHPEDAALVRERLAMPGAGRAWTLLEDPVLARGGCRVTTDTAQIDARLEARLASVAAAVMGDERAGRPGEGES